MVARQSHDVADSQSCIAHEKHHGSRPQPFVYGAADLIAGGDDSNDLLGGKRHNVVGFEQPRPLQRLGRILAGPFAVDAKRKELAQDFDLLDPRPVRLVPPERVAIQALYGDLIHIPKGLACTVFGQVRENPFVLPLRFGRMFCMLRLKGLSRLIQRLARSAESLVLHFGQAPCGALEVTCSEGRPHPFAVRHTADS